MKAVAFLRGMNVGGHRITNAELVTHFEAMGFRGVSTYRASGNVLFELDDERASVIEQIEGGLGERLGYAVPTMVRVADEVRAVSEHQPFASDVGANGGKLQVTFYRSAPSAEDHDTVLAMASDEDRLAIVGRELYWLPIGRMTDSILDVAAIDKRLGVGTTRTMGTVRNIAKKL